VFTHILSGQSGLFTLILPLFISITIPSASFNVISLPPDSVRLSFSAVFPFIVMTAVLPLGEKSLYPAKQIIPVKRIMIIIAASRFLISLLAAERFIINLVFKPFADIELFIFIGGEYLEIM